MIMENLLILGAGQYGVVAKEIAESTHIFSKISFLDDNNPIAVGKLSDYQAFKDEYECAVVAIGNADIRLQLINTLEEAGFRVPSLIHPTSYTAPSSRIAEGCFIEPKTVVNTDVEIGTGCIISVGAILNHNSVVEQGCHIDCGTIVAARKIVESKAKTDIGSVVI